MKGLALAALLATAPAQSQTVKQVGSVLDTTRQQNTSLETLTRNLYGMRVGPDNDVITSVLERLTEFMITDVTPMEVGALLHHMRDPEDARYVRAQLQDSLSRSISAQNVIIDSVNGYLVQEHSQAVIAETTKARDLMISIRDELHSLQVAGSSTGR
jgi:hypothetical protein